jgi:phosphoglycerate dehydrogenase-like enzyme
MAGPVTELRVHIASRLSEEHQTRIRGASPRIRLTYHPFSPYEPPADFERELGDVEVLFSHHARFALSAAPRLRWLQLPGDGVDHLRGAPVMRSTITVTNTRVFGIPIAEYVFASVIGYYRRFPQMMVQFQQRRVWPRNQWDDYCGEDIAGKVMAIIGYGEIGRRIARIAEAADLTVIATRRSVASMVRDGNVDVYPAADLKRVLAMADVVVVCLPLTDETEGIIGEAELRAMKSDAYLVNIGRGKVIEEAALLRALNGKWIGGAGLDTHATTPLPADSPFFDLPNVILTPHMSGVSRGYFERVTALFCENLRRYLAGETLINLVDKDKGY